MSDEPVQTATLYRTAADSRLHRGCRSIEVSQVIVQCCHRRADMQARDEGERYAHILAETGYEVVLKRYPGVPNPFM